MWDDENKFGFGGTILAIVGWLVIAVAVALGVTFKNELGDLTNRVIATFVPGTPYVSPSGEVHIQPDEWDQYWIKAKVNGVSVKFLVDTGASDVSLSSEDAARVGVNLDGLVYSQAYNTANGTAYAAPVVLSSVEVGPISISNVSGSISKPGAMEGSLLGMTYLSRLSGFSIENDTLILKE